jgi:hypothetical protein
VKKKWLLVTVLVATIVCGLGGVYAMGTGIKHAVTVSNGTKANPTTQWNAEHTISNPDNPLQLIWKDASTNALTLGNQNADVTWTTLDLTTATSVKALCAYIQVRLKVEALQDGDYIKAEFRKNGTTPASPLTLNINKGEEGVNYNFYQTFIVGLDSSHVMQYQLTSDDWTNGQVDFFIDVLAYWE